MAKSIPRDPPDKVLKPYLAATLLRGVGATGTALFDSLSDQAATLIDHRGRKLFERFLPIDLGGVRVQAFVYKHKRLASWATQEFFDVTHELVVIGVKNDLIGLCCSEPALRDRLSGKLEKCAAVPRAMLERAFVGTQASAIWLSGIHTPTASKANAKAMTGPALELALDPLGDQSFYYSAVKSRGAYNPKIAVGAAPASSRIWINRPKDWAGFGQALEAVLDHIGTSMKAAAPATPGEPWLKVLAQSSGDITAATNPYAVALMAPELLSEDEVAPEVREKAIAWAYDGKFEVVSYTGASPRCRVSLDGQEIGTVELTFNMVGEKAQATPIWSDLPDGFAAERDACGELLARTDCLRVYYANGTTLAEGRLFEQAYRDQRFKWQFDDFTGYSIEDEKPKQWGGKSLADVIADKKEDGSADDSLFAYVKEKLFNNVGWLASDDGSMEFADFVHIDPANHKVTLVHAKGSNKDDPDRGVSVSNYEVVVSQAVKNIRHLDRSTLATVLKAGHNKKIAGAVWFNGVKQSDRKKLIAFVETLSPDHEKHVIILQPQLTKKENKACVGDKPSATRDRIIRMKQLDTLMLSARLSCGAVGAEFASIGAA
jgi:hypothetical protein